MKKGALSLILVVLCLLAASLRPGVARAAVTFVSISPTSGSVGTVVVATVTRVSGDHSTFSIYWDNVSRDYLGTVNANSRLAYIQVKTDPASFNIVFTIPATAKGAHDVILYDGANQYVRSFYVIPSISAKPLAGVTGIRVSISGTGFHTSEVGLGVTFGGTSVVAGVAADINGTWQSSFAVPERPRGSNMIYASGDNTTLSEVLGVSFTVTPKIIVSSSAAGAGAPVLVRGTGFAVGEVGIGVTLGGTSVVTLITAGNDGTWQASFAVPEKPGGSYIIHASGEVTAASEVPDVSFRVIPKISVSPSSAGAGVRVSVIGTGFGAGETGIGVTFGNTSAATGISADSDGSWQSSFAVSEKPGGSYIIDASGEVTPASGVSDVSFTVIPKISVSPLVGGAGAPVSVSGTGFAAGETGIGVTLGGILVATGITADNNGRWQASFAVPEKSRDSYVVDAFGPSTKAGGVPDVSFRITPRISVSPSSAGAGAQVSVRGTGFSAGETAISVTFGNTSAVTGITADNNGRWQASFTVPGKPRGSYIIDASGPSTTTDVPDVGFSLGAGVEVTPASGHVGDSVTVIGSAFAVNETGINVTFDGAVGKDGIKADDNGYWTAAITIPPSVSGNHTISANGANTSAAEVTGAILATTAKIVLSPGEAYFGADVMVNGSGFSGNQTLTIKYDAITVASGVATGSNGGFSAVFTVPRSIHGGHAVAAGDGGGANAQAAFTVESIAPAVPGPVSPRGRAGGWFASRSEVSFDWQDVTDPGGVFYTLQIGRDANFGMVVLTKSGLTESRYRLSQKEALPQGSYYWRVKALDGASNDSGWTATQPFHVGLIALWAFIAILLLALIITGSVLYRTPLGSSVGGRVTIFWRRHRLPGVATAMKFKVTNTKKTICSAIDSRQVIRFHYHNELCVVEPYCYGLLSDGDETLLCYQVSGYGDFDESVRWRLLRASAISRLALINEHFTGAGSDPEYDSRFATFTTIYCQVAVSRTDEGDRTDNKGESKESAPEPGRETEKPGSPEKPAAPAQKHNEVMRRFRLSHWLFPPKGKQ